MLCIEQIAVLGRYSGTCTRVLYSSTLYEYSTSTCIVKVPGTRVPDLNQVLEYPNFVPVLNNNNNTYIKINKIAKFNGKLQSGN